jgi:hypothetical protein
LRPDVARPFFVAGFVALRVELFADFVTAFRFGVDFFAAALAGARFLQGMSLPLCSVWSADF